MFRSRKCLLTFIYNTAQPTDFSLNFNNPFQSKSCTTTCNLTLEQGRGTVTKLRKETPHTFRALKLSICCSRRNKDMRKSKAENISHPIWNHSTFNMKRKIGYIWFTPYTKTTLISNVKRLNSIATFLYYYNRIH